MRFCLILTLLLNIGSAFAQPSTSVCNKFYEMALREIEGATNTPCKNKVSSEVLSFKALNLYFESNPDSDGVLIKTQDSSLRRLNYRGKAKFIVFFSECVDSVFLAERFDTPRGIAFGYRKRPSFGQSIVYKFKVSGGKVVMTGQKTLSYN